MMVRALAIVCVSWLLLLAPSFPLAQNSKVFNTIEELRKSADSGDVTAERNLAFAYEKGNGVPQDFSEAARWYAKAVLQDDAASENNLGVLYRLGNGVPKDFTSAVKLYSKAAKKEFAPALMNLGIAYYNGEGVPDDPVQAYAWLSLAADDGYVPARDAISHLLPDLSQCEVLQSWVTIGAVYERGALLPQNPAKAMEWYRKAAEAGYAAAQLQLSHGLQSSDPQSAAAWREKAIKQNYGPAMYELAQSYEKGIGTQQSAELAAKWYEKAFRADDRRGAEALGRLYAQGVGVKQDIPRAYLYFYSAARNGVPQAADEATALKQTMTARQKEQVRKIKDIPVGMIVAPEAQCSGRLGSAKKVF
jgi:uncharacterized protein